MQCVLNVLTKVDIYLLNVQLSVSFIKAIKITSRVMIFPFTRQEQYFLYIQCFSKDTKRKE